MSVVLRKEKISGNRQSVYLDIYIDKNNHQQKRLGIYLIPEKTAADKVKNKEAWRLAELIRNEYENDMLNHKYGKEDPAKKYNYSFIEYFQVLVQQRFESNVNFDTWYSVNKHLNEFTGGKMKFSEINETWLEAIRAYLLKKVSQNSAHTYFNKIKRAVHVAFREKLIENDPAMNVTSPKQVDTKREYLTEDEIKILIKTDCRLPILKNAFIFSCLTGLRWSDIQFLTWEKIQKIDGIYHVIYTQKKTNQYERLPIHNDARSLLGTRGKAEERVFIGLKYSAWHNHILSKWVLLAGIQKEITFHSGRHSNATMLLNRGVDIFTVSKMLGHREIRTTQIYTKVVNETKIKAIEMLPNLFNF